MIDKSTLNEVAAAALLPWAILTSNVLPSPVILDNISPLSASEPPLLLIFISKMLLLPPK